MGLFKRDRANDSTRRPNLQMQHWAANRRDYEGQQEGLDASGRNYSGVFINPPTPPGSTDHDAPKYNFKGWGEDGSVPIPPRA